jgi:hypothetical protein
MAPLVLANRRETYVDSARQQLAQVLRDFIQARGGWVTSPLPLADTVALRFDVRSHDAAQINRELGALGLAVRFVRVGLQTGPSSVTELIREDHRIVGARRMSAPCAVTTFEIALPDEKMAASSEGDRSAPARLRQRRSRCQMLTATPKGRKRLLEAEMDRRSSVRKSPNSSPP